jgi:hypothetical protein
VHPTPLISDVQVRTHVAASLGHLVGAGEERGQDREVERFGFALAEALLKSLRKSLARTGPSADEINGLQSLYGPEQGDAGASVSGLSR